MRTRDYSLDLIKAFAIFLVVLGHIISNTDSTENPIRTLIWSVHMPLFFFVSGYLASKKMTTTNEVLLFFINKARIMIPFIVVGGVYSCIFHYDIIESLLYWGKNGYWFLWVLFEFFVILGITNFILLKNRNEIIEIITLIVPVAMCMVLRKFEDTTIGGLLNFLNLYNYIFFILGLLISRYNLKGFVLNDKMQFAFFMVYLIGFFTKLSIMNIPMKASGVLFVFGVVNFYLENSNDFEKNKINNILLYVGRSSLYIYVLHYFIIRGIGRMPEPYHNILYSTPAYYIPADIILSIFVIMLCLIVAEVLLHNKYTRFFVFGTK